MPNIPNIEGRGGKLPYFWLDNAGGKPWSDVQSYLANPTTTPSFDLSNTTGSYALSEKFSVKDGEQVNVAAIVATAHTTPYWDFGFALLVPEKATPQVLFAVRPDGNLVIGDQGPTPKLQPPGSGITFAMMSKDVQGNPKDATGIELNGVNYGSTADVGAAGNQCIYVSAKCRPGKGDYQVLFGMFATQQATRPDRPAALIVPFFNVTQG